MNAQPPQADPNQNDRFSFDPTPHGEGGFARVIKGRDKFLDRDIAVKVLNPLATRFSPPEQERFKREARILAKLSHPNIPSVYDVQFGEGRFLIVSQFIAGTNLRRIIDELGAPDLERVRVWFRQIASALEHAHSLGIIHRDVKPGNIIVTPDRESAYLVDFGIALSQQEVERLTRTGGWIGTPGYMSPEQQAGNDVDARADLYSLGVTLYEALCGKPIPQGQYEDLAAMNQAIPPQIDELVRACLEPRPALRIDSAKTFMARLASALLPNKPMSEVLAHGRLHEIALALRDLTPETFLALPEGQRRLILLKLDDVVESRDSKLQYAAIQLLELLLIRGALLDKESYRQIVGPAVARGFEYEYERWIGRRELRDALEQAASAARPDAHDVLESEFLKYLDRADMDAAPDYLLHDIREAIQTLMANPACSLGAQKLGQHLRRVNRAQTQRP